MKDIDKIIKPNSAQDKRVLFFTGKGGVGKTVASSATAYWLAQQGYKTLLVTTDPADHLSQMFSRKVTDTPQALSGEENLFVARVDQKQAVKDYKERVLSEAEEKYDEEMIKAIKEELNSPCTEEMASFEKFVSFVLDDSYEIIIFDTAPTGHTLRLLELPMDWDQQVELMVANQLQEGEEDEQGKRYKEVISLLRNPEIASFIFVIYPENTPIMEAHRASQDLKEAGINTSLVVANQILLKEYCTTDFFEKRYNLQQKHLSRAKELFTAPLVTLPLLDQEIKGLTHLKEAGNLLWEEKIELTEEATK
ncbi:MAG: ArsA family ATPase [Halanaerobiales bacterium]|nr:ArsA family ATPase [Halanaerobiales bacterium]